MQNIRRDRRGCCPREQLATIDSRIGSAIATAEPRRKRPPRDRPPCRRECSPGSRLGLPVHRRCFLLVPEQVALDDRVDEAAHAERAGLRRVEDLLDLLPIGEPHRRGGEDRQLKGQVPRDRRSSWTRSLLSSRASRNGRPSGNAWPSRPEARGGTRTLARSDRSPGPAGPSRTPPGSARGGYPSRRSSPARSPAGPSCCDRTRNWHRLGVFRAVGES